MNTKQTVTSHEIRQPVKRRIIPTQRLNPAWTFDSFVVGPPNVMAFNAAQWVAVARTPPFNPLFIYANTGLGTTHLLHAIGHHSAMTHGKTAYLTSAESFTNDYIVALQNRGLAEFRTKLRNQDMFLMDDLQFLAGKDRMQEEFLHTFDALHNAGKMIVVTANQPPRRITGLSTNLKSRLESGLCISIERPDRATRVAILNRRLDDMKETLSSECVLYIATYAGWNVRRLEGALLRAVSYKKLSGKDLNLASLKHLLNYLRIEDLPETTSRRFRQKLK